MANAVIITERGKKDQFGNNFFYWIERQNNNDDKNSVFFNDRSFDFIGKIIEGNVILGKLVSWNYL